MENIKMTKKDYFEIIRDKMSDNEDIVRFCDNEIAILEARSAKAKERAVAKKAESDELTDKIYEYLTDEFQSTIDIANAINDETITPNKVVYRLNKLVSNGLAEKADAIVQNEEGKSRSVKVFKRIKT